MIVADRNIFVDQVIPQFNGVKEAIQEVNCVLVTQAPIALVDLVLVLPFLSHYWHCYLEIAVIVGVPEYVMVSASPGDKPNMP